MKEIELQKIGKYLRENDVSSKEAIDILNLIMNYPMRLTENLLQIALFISEVNPMENKWVMETILSQKKKNRSLLSLGTNPLLKILAPITNPVSLNI